MKYSGRCHCGKVRYDVEMKIDQVIACNCSICAKRGHLLAFAPSADFELRSGADALTDYRFGKKRIHHQFCSTCGVASFGRGSGPDGKEMVSINVRCLDGVDAESFPVHRFDGKNA